MNIKYMFYLFFFFPIFNWASPMPVYSTDTITWSGNIELTADYFVNAQQTLQVAPGTVVTATGAFKIEVRGNMIAEGTENNPILFTAYDTVGLYDSATISGGWQGIHLLDNDAGLSRFSYCTFEYGKANVPGSWFGAQGRFDTLNGNRGGGIKIFNYQNAEFEHCTFSHNYSRTRGGGVYCDFVQSITFSSCDFVQNKTMVFGGALYCGKIDSLLVTRSTFKLNTAYYYFEGPNGRECFSNGSAIFLDDWYLPSINNIRNNSFFNNYSLTTIVVFSTNSSIVNNVFTNNYNWFVLTFNRLQSSHTVFNNTMANNYYDRGIPGISAYTQDLRFYNNIMWNNLSDSIQINDMAIETFGNIPDINYNLIWEGRAPGSNMITDDPLFVNPAPNYGLASNGWEYDWSLQDDSPAVNAGTPDTTGMNLLPEDLAGNPRIFGNRIDMGAYENQHVWVKINDSPVFANQIKVYPNPGTDRIMVALPENTTDAWIELFDGTGQRVLLERVYANLCVFTPAHLAPGIYFYRIYNRDQVFKKGKWVKK